MTMKRIYSILAIIAAVVCAYAQTTTDTKTQTIYIWKDGNATARTVDSLQLQERFVPQMVDLGLSVLWADCNIGAVNPWEVGNYYAWGETQTKSVFDDSSYKFGNMDKYNDNDKIMQLEAEDDVATVTLGDKWAMPTAAEIKELMELCTWTYEYHNEYRTAGSRITGPNGNSIFLPSTGFIFYNGKTDGQKSYYLSSTRDDADVYSATALFVDNYGEASIVAQMRITGCAIRPVYHATVAPEAVDLGLTTKWASFNVGASSAIEAGNYYSWGETAPKAKYTWDTYKLGSGVSDITKYNVTDGKKRLEAVDDVATRTYGSSWSIPTSAQMQELHELCTWTPGTDEATGNKYFVVTGPNGNSITLPIAGGYIEGVGNGEALAQFNIEAIYQTSDLDDDCAQFIAGAAIVDAGDFQTAIGSVFRNVGIPVRAVHNDPVHQPELVDLGLSVKWADCNLGASAPSQYGYYLSWGELEAKSDYARSTYKFGATYAELTKYNATDKKTLLEDADDAAKQMLGGEWRMPTLNEVYELITNCTHTWETRDGISGYKFTGPNGNSIFIPASGGRRVYKNDNSSVLDGCGEECALWTSICGGDMTAVSLYFTKDGINIAQTDRNQGFCIRPVR